MVLVERRGDLLPLLELVLHGHHEAVQDGAGKQEATAIEKDKPTEIIQRYCSVNPTTSGRLFSNLVGRPERGVIAARLSSRTNDDLSSLGVPPLGARSDFCHFLTWQERRTKGTRGIGGKEEKVGGLGKARFEKGSDGSGFPIPSDQKIPIQYIGQLGLRSIRVRT